MLYRTLVAAILLTTGAFAQMTSFPKASYFREAFQKAQTRVDLRAPVKLQDFVVDGKLELSLKHYLELVMANNTDVQIQFLSLEIPRNAIQTALGAWDPSMRLSFQTTRATTTTNNPTTALDAGIAVGSTVKNLNQPYSASYTQTLSEGTQYSVQFNGAKTSSSTISPSTYNPSLLTGNLQFAVTQPLLRNRGGYVNRIPLMQAQGNLKISEFNLRSQLITLVNTAENAYWSVIAAREILRVQEKARDTSKAFLDYMQKQLDLGALSPLDIYNPQSQLASSEVAVAQAKFNLIQAEDTLRHQVGVDLDPQVRLIPIVLTEPVELGPADSMPVDREQEVAKALAINPVMKAATQKLDVDDLGIYSAKNGLLPNLQLTTSYTSYGRGGVFIASAPTARSPLDPLVTVPGGFMDALDQMFGFGQPTYAMGLTLTLPIRNRAASAAMANAVVQKKQDALAARNQAQGVRLNILNAVTALEGAKQQLKLAQTQLDFANKNLDAENKKYELGTEINQNVINAQQQVAQAESQVVSQQISVRRSLVNLLTQTGELLDERGIVIK